VGEAAFNARFAVNGVFRRNCTNCPVSHQMIYYKRFTAMPAGFSMYNTILVRANTAPLRAARVQRTRMGPL
jgi:hypothetical protein